MYMFVGGFPHATVHLWGSEDSFGLLRQGSVIAVLPAWGQLAPDLQGISGLCLPAQCRAVGITDVHLCGVLCGFWGNPNSGC